jgi:hypothetical protein
MSSEAKHTSTPWMVPVGEGNDTLICEDINGVPGRVLMDVSDTVGRYWQKKITYEEAAANATFIAHAVNCHGDLLAALKKAEQFIVNGVELGFIRMPDLGTPDPAHDTLPAIRAAISKATGASHE